MESERRGGLVGALPPGASSSRESLCPCEAHLRSAIVEVIVLEEVLDAEEGGRVVQGGGG